MRPTVRWLWLVLAVSLVATPAGAEPVTAVAAVGMTVADMDRAVEFYTRVLGFEPVADVEVAGPDYERLQGVFGLRMRVVRLRLGDVYQRLGIVQRVLKHRLALSNQPPRTFGNALTNEPNKDRPDRTDEHDPAPSIEAPRAQRH